LNYALIIYYTQEETRLFVLPEHIATEYETELATAQGHMVNCDADCEGTDIICTILWDKLEGDWKQYEVSLKDTLKETFTAVYNFGFYV
jgi:hypothetical protein